MRYRLLWIGLSVFLLLSLLLPSCSQKETTETTNTTTQTTASQSITTQVTTTTTTPTTTAPTTTAVTVAANTTAALTSKKPQYGGTISAPRTQNFGAWDPVDNPNASGSVISTVFEHMSEPDWAKGPAGTNEIDFSMAGISAYSPGLVGLIAESWERPDQTTVIFQMRQGIRYAMTDSEASKLVNGREATAADMAFAMNRTFTSTSAQLPGKDFISSITATGKYEVTLKLKSVYYDVWDDITNRMAGPYPPEVVAKYGDLRNWKNWVGTGPFILTDVIMDSSATLIRNPNYWNHDSLNPENQLPYLNMIRWFVMVDAQSRLAAFRTGKIDVTNELSNDEMNNLKRTNPDTVIVAKFLRGMGRSFPNVQEPPFNNVRVRQALLMAIDFDGIVRDYFAGSGVPRGYPLDPTAKEYVPTDQLPTTYVDPVNGAVTNLQDLWTYHPDKAQALLKEAGYPTGFEFTFWLDSRVAEQGQIFQASWAKVGIKANITMIDPTKATALRYQTGGNSVYKGLLMISGGGAENMPNVAQQAKTNSAWNSGGFSDSYFDTNWDKLAAVPDLYANLPQLKDLGLYVMSKVTRIDFPLSQSYSVAQPWIKNFITCGTQAGIATSFYWGYNPVNYIWIDEAVKKASQ